MIHKALAGAWVILGACAPLWVSAQVNPYEADPAAITAGAAFYASRCADCHSADAKGSQGPDLTLLWAAGANDARVFSVVREGVDGSIMPPSFAPDSEIWAMVAYLRSISTVPPFISERGDAALGRSLFAAHCTDCHRLHGRGGTLGPELTHIAQVRSPEALVRAIRDPSESVASGYRAVTLVTKGGDRIEGVVKSEDAFSIQIVDTDQRLQGYIKADLADLIHEEESRMPKFGRLRLSPRELDDLLAFLGTLRDDVPFDP